MRWISRYILPLLLLLQPGLAEAQVTPSASIYIGSARPLSRQETLDSLWARVDTSSYEAFKQETLDSLWAKPDTSELTALQQEMYDSLAAKADTSDTGGGGGTGNPAVSITINSGADIDAVLDDSLTKANRTGGVIYLEGGSYTADNPITLSKDTTIVNDIWIVGEPGRTKINVQVGDGNYLFEHAANRALRKLHFRDIEFIGDASSEGVIQADSSVSDSISFHRCTIRNFTSGSSNIFEADTLSDNWLIERCIFQGNYEVEFDGCYSMFRDNYFLDHTGNGIQMHHWENTIRDCIFRDCAGSSISFLNASDYHAGWRIIDNKIFYSDSSSSWKAIYHYIYSTHAVIQGNWVGSWEATATPVIGKPGYGIYTHTTVNGTVIMNNHINGALVSGIRVQEQVDIMGNHLVNCAVGVEADWDRNSIVGNTFRDCTKGIDIDGGTKSGYAGNTFKGVTTNVEDGGTSTQTPAAGDTSMDLD